MGHRERIRDYVSDNPGKDDDEIALALGITPRQTVNQACRALERLGLISRRRGVAGKMCNFPNNDSGGIENSPPTAQTSRSISLPPQTVTPFAAMPDLGGDALQIAAIAARHCMLPHPNVVEQLSEPVFPTIRHQQRRGEVDEENGLLLDDNVTPRWALLWSHGYSQTHHPRGWTFAHVWPAPKDPAAYTKLANIVMMPESLASLTDKQGPLAPYLRFHAFQAYGWCPAGFEAPAEPPGFGEIEWCYLNETSDALSLIYSRMAELNNQRVIALRKLMGR